MWPERMATPGDIESTISDADICYCTVQISEHCHRAKASPPCLRTLYIYTHTLFFFFLVVLVASGCSQARDRTLARAAT